VNGYLHPDYVASLGEFGTPLELPQCKGWFLKRKTPNFSYYDAMGCYPLFACQDWSKLHNDLENIGDGLVSVSLVTDPFGNYDEAYLKQCFKDVVIPFKEHFVVDLGCSVDKYVSRHRRKQVRWTLKKVNIEICHKPSLYLDDWIDLYSILTKKHNISGIPAFSKRAFYKQLRIPGAVMFRAVYNGNTVGTTLWFIQEEVGYGHLAAFNKIGYKLRVSNALDWSAIEYFSDKLKWLNLGGGSGIMDKRNNDGLSLYKEAWSTGTRTAYFCGRILDRKKYEEIVRSKNSFDTNYFPAYRAGEFRQA